MHWSLVRIQPEEPRLQCAEQYADGQQQRDNDGSHRRTLSADGSKVNVFKPDAILGRHSYTGISTYLSSVDGGLTPSGSLSNPFPNGLSLPTGNTGGLGTGAGGVIDFADQNSKPGYVQQYSVDIQHQFRGGHVVTVGYNGSRTERLNFGGTQDTTVNINQLDPQYFALGTDLLQQVANPFYGNSAFGNLSVSPTISRGQLMRPFPQFDNVLAHRVNDARARYNALSLRWERRLQNNWTLNANYTYSRLQDNQFGESNQYRIASVPR